MNQRLYVPAILAAVSALRADWMQFRGPGGSGTSAETGLPTTWSSKENIVWRTKLPGPGTSSPIVVGKRVYLTCYSGYGLEPGKGEMDKLMRHLVCIDRDKGGILWTKDFKPLLPESKYGPGSNESEHGYSSSTPASDGRRLYVFFGKSGIYCLDLDGKEIWHADVGTGTHGWGSANSPVLFKALVIINASIESSSLVALDKNTGQEIWRAKGISSSWNTPVLVDVPDGGGPEMVVNESQAVIGFEPASGKELWRVTGFGGYVCPSVVAHKGVVYLVRDEALAIKAGGRGDVTNSHVLWRSRKGRSTVPSPVYYDGRLYWAYGSIHCLDAATGKEVYRKSLSKETVQNAQGGVNLVTFYASPLAADGKIYCVSRFSGTFVLAAGPTFKELAHNQFEDDNSRTNASPIVSDGCLLLRTDRYLVCIGKK
ncbi:MAG TPA: PQQ-binding-like beta-propeller repeat protein [Gemmataceae bacterium]|nr:PQQ-binding-like beta-propeller repeat protein [Gemmataceae bacterium]